MTNRVTPAVEEELAREAVLTRDFVLVSLANFAFFASFYMLLPVLPLYVKSLGGEDSEVGLIVGVFTVAAVVARLFAGRAGDIWGPKSFLVAGTFVFLVGALLYNWTADVGAMLLVLRFLHGIGFGMAGTAASAIAAAIAPVARRGEALGYYGMTTSLSIAVAPGLALGLLGLSVLGVTSFALVFSVSGGIAVVALLFALLLRSGGQAEPGPHHAMRTIGIRGFFAVTAIPVSATMFLAVFTYAAIFTFLPLYAPREQTGDVAVFFTVYAITVLLSRPVSGIASDRLGRRAVVIPAVVLSAIGAAMLVIAPSLPVFVAAAIVYGIGFGALYSTLLALAVDVVEPRERGTAMGMFQAAFDAGMAVGAMALGIVAQVAGYPAMFLIAAGMAVVGLGYFVVCGRGNDLPRDPSRGRSPWPLRRRA